MANLFDTIWAALFGDKTHPVVDANGQHVKLNPTKVVSPVDFLEGGISDTLLNIITNKKLSPQQCQEFADAINAHMHNYNVTQVMLPMYLCQVLSESQNLTVLEENLNYITVAALRRAWPSRFTSDAIAKPYLKNPQKLAEFVYGGREDLGNMLPGDGWRMRGAGAIQLTGRANHEAFAEHINYTLDNELAYIRTPEGAIESSLWFWWKHNLGRFTTREQVKTCTLIVNGGTNGLADRLAKFDQASQKV